MQSPTKSQMTVASQARSNRCRISEDTEGTLSASIIHNFAHLAVIKKSITDTQSPNVIFVPFLKVQCD